MSEAAVTFSEEAEKVLDGMEMQLESERGEDATSFTITDSLGVVQAEYTILNNVEQDQVLSEVATAVISATPRVLFQYLQELIAQRNAAEAVFDETSVQEDSSE